MLTQDMFLSAILYFHYQYRAFFFLLFVLSQLMQVYQHFSQEHTTFLCWIIGKPFDIMDLLRNMILQQKEGTL